MPSSARPLALIVTSTLPRWQNDTEPRFILDLCQALAERYRILVLAPHCRGAATAERWGDVEIRRFRYFAEWGEVLCYEGGILPKLRQRPWLWALVPFFVLAQIVALVRVLRTDPVALVHAHWFIPQGMAAGLALAVSRRPAPLICTAHGTDVLGLRSAMAQGAQRWVARRSARVGVVSAALGDELARRGVAREKLRELPMGVSISSTLPDPLAREPDLIAYAGRIVESKGVGVLLDAFRSVLRALPAARLVIAGGGPDLEHFREIATGLGIAGRVEFRDAVPQAEVLKLFSRASVAAMPSIAEEGLGLTMLEAMACGCPVVATDLPAVRSVASGSALLVSRGDADALAGALLQHLDDREQSRHMSNAGRKMVEARFSWAAAADRHHIVFREVLDENSILMTSEGSSANP